MRAFGVMHLSMVNFLHFCIVAMKVMYDFVPLNNNGDVQVCMQEKIPLSVF